MYAHSIAFATPLRGAYGNFVVDNPWVCGAIWMPAPVCDSEARSQVPDHLRTPESFQDVGDMRERSRALFSEAAKVITSPRCMNCHPADDTPRQGDDRHAHTPPVTRGLGGNGVPGNTCQACHTQANYTLAEATSSYQSIPGHPRWGLAPIEMAWQGKSVGQICAQMKDPARNGGRTLALLHNHLAHDDLVAWGLEFRGRP